MWWWDVSVYDSVLCTSDLWVCPKMIIRVWRYYGLIIILVYFKHVKTYSVALRATSSHCRTLKRLIITSSMWHYHLYLKMLTIIFKCSNILIDFTMCEMFYCSLSVWIGITVWVRKIFKLSSCMIMSHGRFKNYCQHL
jgi:hypothetical protein